MGGRTGGRTVRQADPAEGRTLSFRPPSLRGGRRPEPAPSAARGSNLTRYPCHERLRENLLGRYSGRDCFGPAGLAMTEPSRLRSNLTRYPCHERVREDLLGKDSGRDCFGPDGASQ